MPADLPPAMWQMGVWRHELAGHPDQQFARYIMGGLSQGFRIGFQHGTSTLRQAAGNMPIKEPEVVSVYIKEELGAERLVELTVDEAARLEVHCSPIGIIPEKNKPGKWRLIMDLSSPDGASVNDGIEKDTCSLSYISVYMVAALGVGALLSSKHTGWCQSIQKTETCWG